MVDVIAMVEVIAMMEVIAMVELIGRRSEMFPPKKGTSTSRLARVQRQQKACKCPQVKSLVQR